jgi:SPP1 gp7 family putative phage head morphogenesis protein
MVKITKKKKKWVKQFKPTSVMRGKPLPYNVSVQQRYIKDLEKLMDEVIKETEKEVKQIYNTEASKAFFTTDASIASTARIRLNNLLKTIENLVTNKASSMVKRMLRGTDQTSKSSMNQSLKELSGGLSIKTDFKTAGTQEAITSSFNANIDLIKTMTGDYTGAIRGAVNRSIQGGGGLETLIPDIEKFLNKQAKQTLNKAKNVALDQTRKAYTAINKARMEKVGISKFEWVHSGGGREPRPHHKTPFPNGLNHGIFDINDPPVIDTKTGERGLPGQAINCKCFMRPVIQFDEGAPVE